MSRDIDGSSGASPGGGIHTPFGLSREISITQFFRRVLPQLRHELNPTQVLETIKTSKTSPSTKPLTKNGRWRGFAKDPIHSTHSATHTFSHLESVVQAVITASILNLEAEKPKLSLKSNPNSVTTYQDRSDTTLPDAFFTEGGERAWKNVAVCGEYKKESTPEHVKDLGWDENMKPLPDGSNFDITIRSAGQDRTYRTQKMLADRGSRYLLGKATRVWKAVRLEDGAETGSLVALKDCWVDPSRTREGEILRRIRHNILSASPGDEDLVVRLFPAFEWDGDVLTGDDKSTLDLTCVLSETKTSADVTEDQEQSGSPRPTKAASTAALVHYRLVVSPASDRPVEHETSVSTIYNTLAHAAGGWVHRDISTGNITLDEKRARLVDFELAKQESDEDNLNIGTVWFKAYEVEAQSYLFRPPPIRTPREPRLFSRRRRPKLTEGGDLPDPEAPDAEVPKDSPAENQKTQDDVPLFVPVRYNPLHDLESLLWVAIYFLLKREICDPPEQSETDETQVWDRERQRKYADEAFTDDDTRFNIMVTTNLHTDAVDVIHPAMYPVLVELCSLRQALAERYTEVEEDPRSIPYDCAKGLHTVFMTGFFQISDDPQVRDLKLRPLSAPPALIHGVATPAVAPAPEAEEADKKEDTNVHEVKAEIKKVEKTRRRRKNSTTVTAVHRYNLRPRPTRG
ncbi:hypothetical protein EIP86_010395 [Pleurotus ostreatoroseus]|nr:hypothetical protein EIP86_010395 [Pleurotus ostreatoroseus]